MLLKSRQCPFAKRHAGATGVGHQRPPSAAARSRRGAAEPLACGERSSLPSAAPAPGCPRLQPSRVLPSVWPGRAERLQGKEGEEREEEGQEEKMEGIADEKEVTGWMREVILGETLW